jgi:hypothetical protein
MKLEKDSFSDEPGPGSEGMAVYFKSWFKLCPSTFENVAKCMQKKAMSMSRFLRCARYSTNLHGPFPWGQVVYFGNHLTLILYSVV